MILCTPDLEQQNYTDKKMVFLAGPIMGAEDWQSRAIADLVDDDIYLASPRKAWQPAWTDITFCQSVKMTFYFTKMLLLTIMITKFSFKDRNNNEQISPFRN